VPAYDYICDACGLTREVTKPMAEAGRAETCGCGQTLRRLYAINPVVMRPWGYSTSPTDPRYWDGFDNEVPAPLQWQRGGAKKASPGPTYVGVGGVYKA
jgi:putative FmdB family regulatory protein